MRLGALNREVTVLKKSTSDDPVYNTEEVTWVPLSILPGSPEVAERFAAEVTDLPPSRVEVELRGALALAKNVVRVRMRWRNDVDATMRVVVHGDTDRTLLIIGGPAEFGGRKVGIEMYCEEVSS